MPGLTSLDALAGRWSLTRTIEHAGGGTDRFQGFANFTWSGAQLVQTETGTLTVGGQNLEAKQTYIWEGDRTAIAVYFADHRPFHTVLLKTERPTSVHLCDPDRYTVTYNFSDWPQWQSVWSVTGPRKDYEMTSLYHRL